MLIKTKLDFLTSIIGKTARLPYLAKQVSINPDDLEQILEWLEEERIVELYYVPIPFVKPSVKVLFAPPTQEERLPPKSRIIEEYDTASSDGTYQARVYIYKDKEGDMSYYLDYPMPGPITASFLRKLKDEIALFLPPETYMMTEEERRKKIYEKQLNMARNKLSKIVDKKEDADVLAGIIRSEMYGIGKLEYFLIDPKLEEVVINSANKPIVVYHREYGWLKTNILFPTEADVSNLAVRIARRVGKQITTLSPLLDAHLINGERTNATLYPISVSGNTLTIRKFSEEPYTLPFLIKNGTLTADMASLLWQAEELEMNVLVVGGTASGKTTMLNALLMLSNPFQRVITIEDTRELNLPTSFENWVPMVTRSPNPEGLGEVSLLDLMVNSLRMRPDRIIVGEVRRKEEAIVMFEAMHTGHSVYSTFHADTAYIALKRLQEEPIGIPIQEMDILDLIVTQRRNRKTGTRRTFEIAQIMLKETGANVDRVYSHRARMDTFDFHGLPIKYREKVSLYTGMTQKELNEDLEDRVKILKYLIKHRMTSMESMEEFVRAYYKDRDDIISTIREGKRLRL